jgi:Helix-turn-helix domain
MTVIAMSRTEIDRMRVLQDLAAGRVQVAEAATLMGLGRRQVYRLAKAYHHRGPAALVSRRRGRQSNRSYPADIRAAAIAIIRERYADFGPTLAAEKLAELHGICLARETVRQWMIAADLWKDRRARLKPVHQPRYRRDCLGELIQIDGSEHWWFEDRGPRCTLLVYIDDATSRLMHLQFVESESTFDYFAATRTYLERHGKPIAFYSDKHGVFRVNKKDAIGGDGMTQFGRALHALNIDIICANSSQAKGRVERANGTLQDRLVKEMRLSGVDTIEAGNAFLLSFMEKYNARFAKAPFDDRDVHRALIAGHDDLDETFAWKEERTVSMNLTLQYDQHEVVVSNQSPLSKALNLRLVRDDGYFARSPASQARMSIENRNKAAPGGTLLRCPHHASMQGLFFSVLAGGFGAERRPAMIHRRVSAGSMTLSISKTEAIETALPFA